MARGGSRQGPGAGCAVKKGLVLTVYGAMAFAGLLCAAPFLQDAWLALTRPCAYLPGLRAPGFWVAASLVTAGALFHVVRSTFLGSPHRRQVAALMLVASASLVVGRLLGVPADTGPVPGIQLGHAFARARAVLAAATVDGRYPARFPGDGVLRDARGHPVVTGYLGHGRRLPFRVVTRTPAAGAALTARADDRPGTLYYVRRPDGGTYWLTALMMAGTPVGPARFVRDPSSHQAVVVHPDPPTRSPE